jgi:hypothetical protein
MRLRNAGEIDRAIMALSDLQGRLMNYRGHDDTFYYLAWCEEASRQFREQFASLELAELAERDHRDVALAGTIATRPLEFLDRNIDIWQARLVAAKGQLEALKPFIERPGQIAVPDTSAFIEGEYFTDFDWRQLTGVQPAGKLRLIVPMLVIDELDDLKRDRRAGQRARSVLRRLRELQGAAPLEPCELAGRPGVTIEVLVDALDHSRLPDNDAEIIDRAQYIGELTGQSVLLVAGDYGMLYRAAAVGLGSVLIPSPAASSSSGPTM